MVAHDIICFVEGGSQGHSERRGGKKTDVCFPERLCVCGREGPVSREEETAGRQTDRQTEWQVYGQEETGRRVEAD